MRCRDRPLAGRQHLVRARELIAGRSPPFDWLSSAHYWRLLPQNCRVLASGKSVVTTGRSRTIHWEDDGPIESHVTGKSTP